MYPSQRARAQQCQQISRRVDDSDAYAFFNLLTGPAWFDQVEALLPEHRERLFPPTETLSMLPVGCRSVAPIPVPIARPASACR